MRLSAIAFFMIMTTVFLSGCEGTKLAALQDNGSLFYGRTGIINLPVNLAASQSALSPGAGVTANAAPVMPVAVSEVSAPSTAQKPTNAKIAANTWQWPVQGKVVEKFGKKRNGVVNEGIVISASEGTPIQAAQAGKVAYVGRDNRSYGNIAILRHEDGTMTAYSHAREIVVKKDEELNSGALLGYVGKTGSAKKPQLHFAIRQGKTSIDPMTRLPHQVASN